MNGFLVVFSLYLLASASSLALMGWDKFRATKGRRRVSERTLHLVELAGGWPGAIVGMRLFRHKSRKAAFWAVTLGIAMLHAAAWVVYLLLT